MSYQHNKKGKFCYSVEVQLLNFNNTTQNIFNDNTANSIISPANSDDIIVITHLNTYFSSIYQITQSGRPIISQADASLLQMTYKVEQDDRIFQVPYLDACKFLNYGELYPIIPTPMNLVKSYIQVMGALANNGFSAYVSFWYDKLKPAEWKQLKAEIDADAVKYHPTSK